MNWKGDYYSPYADVSPIKIIDMEFDTLMTIPFK